MKKPMNQAKPMTRLRERMDCRSVLKRIVVLWCPVVFAVASIGNHARAGLIVVADGLPAEYTPGDTVLFDVVLQADDATSAATRLSGFDLSLSFSLPVSDPGTFVSGSAVEPPSGYLFENVVAGLPPAGQRVGLVDGSFLSPDGKLLEVDFGDALDPPNFEEVGFSPRRLGTISLLTSANASSDITIGFNDVFTEFFDQDGMPVDVAVSVAGTTIAAAIPEPSSLLLFGVFGVVGCTRRRRG